MELDPWLEEAYLVYILGMEADSPGPSRVMSQREQRELLDRLSEKILAFFGACQRSVFSKQHIADVLHEDTDLAWSLLGVSLPRIVSFLVANGVVQEITLGSPAGTLVTRYARSHASPFEVAQSLADDCYLCHESALYLNGLADAPSPIIYINQEQTPKPRPSGRISQETIDRAFRSPQRRSKREYTYGRHRILVLNGKQTGNLGTGMLTGDSGEHLRATLLERTLIDVVVRPEYAGGPARILEAYRRSVPRLAVEQLATILRALDHVYPYHQVIGFYLERAGVPGDRLKPLRELGLNFDFYLAYGMSSPEYDAAWRVFFPKALFPRGMP